MRRSAHALGRAADGLRLDPVRDIEKKRDQVAADALGEIENQIPVEISGIAASEAAWADVTVEFAVDFVDAPEQRNSPLTTPHFTYGADLRYTDPDGAAVALGAFCSIAVIGWIVEDERGVFTGARVRVGLWTPGDTVHVHGFLHLTFQGYGAPVEDYDGS